jgi:hypothetical protein
LSVNAATYLTVCVSRVAPRRSYMQHSRTRQHDACSQRACVVIRRFRSNGPCSWHPLWIRL